MQMASMKVEDCVISEFRVNEKTREVVAELCYMGGRESVKLLAPEQKDQFPTGRSGTAILQMVPKQVIQSYKDGQFISSNWRCDFMSDFKASK